MLQRSILASLIGIVLLFSACQQPKENAAGFLHVAGENILTAEGDTFFIQGINIGQWLNPEGYMLGFRRTNSPHLINEAFCQMIGPDETARFWQEWKEAYITEADIRYIASTGANTIRLPFHYKLFTNEPYLGTQNADEGFLRMDSVVVWSKRYGLHVILDMHDAPGGQTGDNIDDSYGYPWLMVSEPSKELFCNIWKRIAQHYANEETILGYELINEPIAHYFANDLDSLNAQLEPLYKRAVASIREVDTNHIILLGGAQWNGTFAGVFHDWTFDDKIMYTCHRYGQPSTREGIQDLIAWRDSTHICMYMGETGHNTIEWIEASCRLYAENNIGYTFWPYKKMNQSSWLGFNAPEHWDEVVAFVEGDRSTYLAARTSRPDQGLCREALFSLIDSCRFSHCTIDSAYIRAMQLQP